MQGVETCAPDGLSFLGCTGCPNLETQDAAAACGPGIYPCGPYGYSVGTTIANLAMVGKRDTDGSGKIDAADQASVIDLASLAVGAKAIVIDVCAEWCAPCRQDQPSLNAMSVSYGGQVAFFDVMMQTNNFQPGDLASVVRWGTQNAVPYPIAADATGEIGPYFRIAAFPFHMLVRTSDMQIIYANVGAADGELQTEINGVLASP